MKDITVQECYSIKTFEFSTLYTTMSHSKMKYRLKGVGPFKRIVTVDTNTLS